MSSSSRTLEVAVAALDDGIRHVADRLLLALAEADVDVLIIHQTEEPPVEPCFGPRVRYIVRNESGLSRSRNVALEAAGGDIVILADDDSEFLPGAFDRIRAAYERHPEAAAITFRNAADTRWPDDFVHNARTVGQVYSLVITFRPEVVRRLGVRFDERFGLGADWPQGEDNIFLADLRRAGGAVVGVPERIIPEPGETSGDLFTSERITTKVVVARRMYGLWAGIALTLRFAWTKRALYRAQGVSPPKYAVAAWRGLRARVARSPNKPHTTEDRQD